MSKDKGMQEGQLIEHSQEKIDDEIKFAKGEMISDEKVKNSQILQLATDNQEDSIAIKKKICDAQEFDDVANLINEIGDEQRAQQKDPLLKKDTQKAPKVKSEDKKIAPRLKQEDIIFSADIAQCLVKEIPPVPIEISGDKHLSAGIPSSNDKIQNKMIHESVITDSIENEKVSNINQIKDPEMIQHDFSMEF